MIKTITTCLFILLTLPVFAQYKIQGTITNESGQPVEFASVIMINLADTNEFVGTAGTIDGKFEFIQAKYASYILKVSAVGYSTYLSAAIEGGKNDSLHVTLLSAANGISEFTVQEKMNKIEMEAGKITLNVENTSLSVGQNALDLMRRIPGVFVDNDGNITVKGKQDVMVYLDGRPTYMSGTQLKNFLKSLNASNISKIEVITQPGANYDAEGNAGIINIVLRKKIALGFNGTVDAWYGQGFYPKGGGGFSFNYGKGKINIYGSYNFSHYENYIWPQTSRNIAGMDYATQYWGKGIDNNHALRFNIDYEINNKWTLGAAINGMIGHNNWIGHTESYFSDTAGALVDSMLTVQDSTPWFSSNLQVNLNTSFKMDTLGQKLTINADGGWYTENTRGFYKYGFLTAMGNSYRTSPDVFYRMNPNLYLVSGKIDYENPHFFKFELKAGIKSSYVVNGSDVVYNTYNGSGQTVVIPGQTNNFIYQENINAIYISLKRKVKSWTFSAGLRGEHSNITGTQKISGQVNRQNYFSFFPSAGISFNPNEKHSLSFMYSRRIDRPEYSELNPFIYIMDNYSSFQGNPNLKPQFSHNFDVNYTFMQGLTFSATYNLINNCISESFAVDSLNPQRLVFSKRNLGEMHNFSGGVSFMMPVTKWFTMMVSANAIYTNITDSYLNINRAGWYGMFSGYFEFSLPKKFTLELSGWAMTSQPSGQFVSMPMGDVSAGISKKLLKDKLILKFNVSDIFRTSQWRSTTTAQDGQSFRTNFWWDSRVFTLAVSWNFGTAIKQAAEKDKDAIFDRVGGGR